MALSLLLAFASSARGAAISGTITDLSGNPIPSIDLDIYDNAGVSITSLNATSDASGNYSFTNVPNGTYRVKADPPSSSSFLVDEFWSGDVNVNAYDLAQAAYIAVNGASVTGINFKLDYGATLAGSVKAAQGGAAIAGVYIDLYDPATHLKLPFFAVTDAAGAYKFKPFATGPSSNFIVKANASKTTQFVDLYYNGQPDISTANPVTINRNQNKTGINFNLGLGGRITGTITEQGVGPILNMDLDLFDANDVFLPEYDAKTDAAGAYVLGAVPAGVYKLRADPDPATFLIRQYWNNQPDILTATLITVTAGVDSTNKNFTLQHGGVISGTITEQAAGPVDRMDLDVFDANDVFLGAYDAKTDPNGAYVLGPMPAGTYKLRADPDPNSYLIRQYWNNQLDIGSANLITLAANQTRTANFTLQKGGNISGRITAAAGGAPIDAIDLDVFDSASGAFLAEYDAQSDPNGNYLIRSMPPGSYDVRADAVAPQPYVDQYWNGVDFASAATPISVTKGATKPNINFALKAGALIQGTVTDALTSAPVSGLEMRLYKTDGTYLAYDKNPTSAAGVYDIGPVPAGTYVLRANPALATGYFPQYYSSAMTLAAATHLVVSTSTVTANLALGKSRTVGGTIRDRTSNAALSGVTARLYDQGGTLLDFLAASTTDASGLYSLGPVLGGTYFVEGVPASGDAHFSKFYQNSDTFAGATAINTASADVTNANFTLPLPAKITGSLHKTGSGAALVGLTVEAYASTLQGGALAQAQSDAQGAFTLDGLRTGSYKVAVQLQSGAVYWAGSGTPGGVSDPNLATIVSATEAQTTSGLDLVLTTSQPGQAQGTVLESGGLAPLAGLTVEAFTPGDVNDPFSSATTDAQGNYSLLGLWTGNYLIALETHGGRRYWAGSGTPLGVTSPAQATQVATTDDQTTSGIDFQANPAGKVAGAVLESGSLTPLANRTVEAFAPNDANQPLATGTTDAQGAYTLPGLWTGGYHIALETTAGRRYWAGAGNPLGVANVAQATLVSTVDGTTTSGINFQVAPSVTVPVFGLGPLAAGLLLLGRRRLKGHLKSRSLS